MYLKKIKYIDFNGNEREEEFLFNLTETEVLEWMASTGEDYSIRDALEVMRKKGKAAEIMEAAKDLIIRSYGEKSLDGRLFIKNDQTRQNLLASNAYSVLFMELCTDAKAAADFINGIFPADLTNRVNKIKAENPGKTVAEIADSMQAASR